MSDSSDDKQFAPTPRKRESARNEGRVVRSGQVVSAIALLAALTALRYGGRFLAGRVEHAARETWSNRAGVRVEPAELLDWFSHEMLAVGVALLPLFGLIVVAALAANYAQVGWLFQPQRLGSRFDPLSGFARFGRLTSLDGWYQMTHMVVQTIVIGATAYLSLRSRFGQWQSLVAADERSLGVGIGVAVFDTGLHVAWALAALAAVDYAWRWWRHEQSLRMSDQEMREELRLSGGRRAPLRPTGRSSDARRIPTSVPQE